MRSACVNSGPDIHLLDHIAPLADLLNIPLITTEEENAILAEKYYPQVPHTYIPDLNITHLAQFDALYECKYWKPELKLFLPNTKLIFCPHGQSDKGFNAPLLAPYALQDEVLLYGDLLFDMLQELNIPLNSYRFLGNFRLAFYKKYKTFYDALAPKIDRTKKTLLYAPTWNDADGATSFFTHTNALLNSLPSEWNLLVKPHPLLEQRDPARYYRLAAEIEKKATLITDFPPVYPILSLADAYLGDASSVGYDFLAFQKPMYFFPAPPSRLHAAGKIIDPGKDIFSQLEAPALQEKQLWLYKYAFTRKQEIE